MSVPKVLSLSSMKYSLLIFLIFECTRETEISSPILTSQDAFLPIYKFDLLSVFRIKKTLLLENSSLWFPELKVSRMIKLSLGFSTSIISKIWLLRLIENGNFYLQSSQFTFLYLIITCPFTAFIVLFLSNHSLKHLRWIPPIVPLQWHGLIMGLNSTLL